MILQQQQHKAKALLSVPISVCRPPELHFHLFFECNFTILTPVYNSPKPRPETLTSKLSWSMNEAEVNLKTNS